LHLASPLRQFRLTAGRAALNDIAFCR
jgi:hypothetical protein